MSRSPKSSSSSRLPILSVAAIASLSTVACASDSGENAAQPTTLTPTSVTAAPTTAVATSVTEGPNTTELAVTTAPTSVESTKTTQARTTATVAGGPDTTEPTTTTLPSTETRYLDPLFEVDVQRDLIYGSAPAPDGSGEMVELRLDLYMPRGDTEPNRPVFIYSHGGSFAVGDKAEGVGWATRLAERGYVAASIQYRLGPLSTVTVPLDEQELAQITRARSDLQSAVRWFRAGASLLGVDSDRIAVGGYSAGAIMSAVAAVRSTPAEALPPGTTGSNPEFSSAVCGAVAIAGSLNPAFVDPGDAGVIFHHGTSDTTVPFALGELSRDALLAAGLPVAWHEYPGEGHDFSAASWPVIETTSIKWLYDHVATAPYPCSPAVGAGAPVP